MHTCSLYCSTQNKSIEQARNEATRQNKRSFKKKDKQKKTRQKKTETEKVKKMRRKECKIYIHIKKKFDAFKVMKRKIKINYICTRQFVTQLNTKCSTIKKKYPFTKSVIKKTIFKVSD